MPGVRKVGQYGRTIQDRARRLHVREFSAKIGSKRALSLLPSRVPSALAVFYFRAKMREATLSGNRLDQHQKRGHNLRLVANHISSFYGQSERVSSLLHRMCKTLTMWVRATQSRKGRASICGPYCGVPMHCSKYIIAGLPLSPVSSTQ